MSTKLERVIALDAQIRTAHYPHAASIARQFEVSERTAYDDYTFLKDRLNAPVEYDQEREGWYYTEPSWVLPALIATEGELLALLLSTEFAGNYLGGGFEVTLRKATASLAHSLPNQVQLDLNELAAHYTFTAGATATVNPRLLTELSSAIRDRRPVEVSYYTASRDARNERVLLPYALRNVQGDWNLVAHDSLRNEVRIFALPRIERWQIMHGQQFDVPDDFSLDQYISSGFLSERGGEPQAIAIRFDAYQARYIRERRWHATQQRLEEQSDGGVILRFESGALEEIQRWVMQFGRHAEVLSPTALRTAVAADIADLAQKYAADCINTP